MGFLPAKDPDTMMYFVQQTMTWMFFIIPVMCVIKDRMELGMMDDPGERQPLDLWPLYFNILMVITRKFIIAIRYGTTSKSALNTMNTGKLSHEAYYERLLRLAWI